MDASLSASPCAASVASRDRKSTRLNSSHITISYAVFCLKKKKIVRGSRHCAREEARYSGRLADVGRRTRRLGALRCHGDTRRGLFVAGQLVVFFFNDTATTEIYTLSLHDALPISTELAGMESGNRYLLALLGFINAAPLRSEEHTSELQSHHDLVCRLLLEKK